MTWRLLVVDDDLAVLRGLRRALGLSGFAVETAADGEAALGLLDKGGVDAVVTDASPPAHSATAPPASDTPRPDASPLFEC